MQRGCAVPKRGVVWLRKFRTKFAWNKKLAKQDPTKNRNALTLESESNFGEGQTIPSLEGLDISFGPSGQKVIFSPKSLGEKVWRKKCRSQNSRRNSPKTKLHFSKSWERLKNEDGESFVDLSSPEKFERILFPNEFSSLDQTETNSSPNPLPSTIQALYKVRIQTFEFWPMWLLQNVSVNFVRFLGFVYPSWKR